MNNQAAAGYYTKVSFGKTATVRNINQKMFKAHEKQLQRIISSRAFLSLMCCWSFFYLKKMRRGVLVYICVNGNQSHSCDFTTADLYHPLTLFIIIALLRSSGGCLLFTAFQRLILLCYLLFPRFVFFQWQSENKVTLKLTCPVVFGVWTKSFLCSAFHKQTRTL